MTDQERERLRLTIAGCLSDMMEELFLVNIEWCNYIDFALYNDSHGVDTDDLLETERRARNFILAMAGHIKLSSEDIEYIKGLQS